MQKPIVLESSRKCTNALLSLNKRLSKLKGQLRMDNPETRDTERRQRRTTRTL